MGWASGSGLLSEIVEILEESAEMPDENRVDLYLKLIELFEGYDCDTIDECEGVSDAMDEAVHQWRVDNGYLDEEW